MRSRWLLLPLFLWLAGCATLRPTPVEFPPLINRALVAQQLSGLPLQVSLDPSWEMVHNRFGDYLWRGPMRVTGRPELRLTVSQDSRQPLPTLVEAAARLQGVEAPTPAKSYAVAAHEGYCSSGFQGMAERKIVAIGWQEKDFTFLLLASWVDNEDGAVLATMIDAIKSSPPILEENRR